MYCHAQVQKSIHANSAPVPAVTVTPTDSSAVPEAELIDKLQLGA
ncbi:MAG: hypothetical protein Q8O99_04905 [bacterium]|nr:hypothetical protein [bacterium]